VYVSLGGLRLRVCVRLCVYLLPLISRTAAIISIQHTRCYDDTRVPATVAAPPLRERRVPPKRLIEF